MDLMTVITLGTLLMFVIGVAMILTPSEDPAGRRGAQLWGLAMIVQAAGWLVSAGLRPAIPLFVTVTLGNTLLLLSLMMCLQIICQSKSIRINMTRYYQVMVLVLLAGALAFFLVPDNPAVRLVVSSAFACFIYARVAILVLISSRPTRSEIFTGVIFLICAVALFTRALAYLQPALDGTSVVIINDQVNTLTYLAMCLAGILMTFGYLLMGHDHDIRHLREIENKMRHLAQHDALTDLPNRALFNDRLQRALANAKRDDTRMALMFLDVNRFKSVNDNLGHAAGDSYLQELANRLKASVREQDTVARIGGDEFVILLPVVQSPADALTVAGKVMINLRQPVMLEGQSLGFYVSVGIACYPDDGLTDEALQSAADRSMYHAKSAGDNQIQMSSDARPADVAGDLFAPA